MDSNLATHCTGMHRQSIDIVIVLLDHPVYKSIFDAEDDSQLSSRVQSDMRNPRIVDFSGSLEPGCRWSTAVHFRRFPHDPRCRRFRKLRGLPQQRPEQIADVELAQPIDLEVPVYLVHCLAVLVHVDAGGENELWIDEHHILIHDRNIPGPVALPAHGTW